MKKAVVAITLTLFATLLFGDAAEEVKKQKEQLEDIGISPGDVAIDSGKEQFDKQKGANGKTCSGCHGKGGGKIKTAFAAMPKYYNDARAVLDLDMRIKYCLEKKMAVKNFKRDSSFINYAFFVASLANGQKIRHTALHAKEKQILKKGKQLWYARSGVLDLSCSSCHETYGGKRIRLQELMVLDTEKAGKRWPAYRFGTDATWTLEDRIRACYKQTRVPAPDYHSDTVLSLSAYIMSRSKDAVVAIPGLVR